MPLFNIIAIILTLAAIFSYINYKWIKLPTKIGLMLISLIFSIILILLDKTGFDFSLIDIVKTIDFNQTLMVGMLSFLLFAGALHVNINDLNDNKIEIGIFATIGIIISTFLIGTLFFYLTKIFNLNIPFIFCLLFGSLISPTDPIAVLGILKKANTPKNLEIKITGESLFNDGVGVVVFIVLLEIASGGHDMAFHDIILLFSKEVLGGILLGIIFGWIAFRLLKQIDQYDVEILITLALVTGGYALSLFLHISGPIFVVVSGLMVGNSGRKFAMSDITRENLDKFWELIDEILNSVLFVLIGLEVIMVALVGKYIIIGLITIPIVLFVRLLSIGIPVNLLKIKNFKQFSPNAIKIMTWGGLRGGISVALALSLPAEYNRDVFLTVTYVVVIFSLFVQGLTLKYLVQGNPKK